jgi:hypothetical protein
LQNVLHEALAVDQHNAISDDGVFAAGRWWQNQGQHVRRRSDALYPGRKRLASEKEAGDFGPQRRDDEAIFLKVLAVDRSIGMEIALHTAHHWPAWRRAGCDEDSTTEDQEPESPKQKVHGLPPRQEMALRPVDAG